IIRLLRQILDLRPALDLAHRHDLDAVLVAVDIEADELGNAVPGALRHSLWRFVHSHSPKNSCTAGRSREDERRDDESATCAADSQGDCCALWIINVFIENTIAQKLRNI